MSSNKMPIKWHEESLKNIRLYREDILKQIASRQEQADRLKNDIVKLETQIKLAKEKGMEGFDPDRFNVKKK